MRRRVAAASRSACSGVRVDPSGACASVAGRVLLLPLVPSTRRVALARLDRCVLARSDVDGAGDCAVAALGAADSCGDSTGAGSGGDVGATGAAGAAGTLVEEDDDDVGASDAGDATDGGGAIAAGAPAGSAAAPVGATGGAAAGAAAPVDSEGAAPAGGAGAGGVVAWGASVVVVGMALHCVATAAATNSAPATSHPMRRPLRGGG